MKKSLKCLTLLFLCLCCCVSLFGCEKEPELNVAHISEITSPQSTTYAIKVTLDKDDRVKDKYADLQILSSVEGQVLKFWEENEAEFSICLQKKDYWYNLTYLIDKANGTGVEGGYKKYDDFGTRVFSFTSPNDVKLTFRVVAGQTKKNTDSGEEILVLSEEISKEVTVNIKKFQKK